jgi:hypothetical protein
MAGLGGTPEGLTEGMLALVEQYRPVLPPPDIVRLLTVLGTMENQLRTTGHPRLVVELLLLRWSLADRTVEIAEVIRALGPNASSVVGRQGPEGGRSGERAPVLRDVAPSAPLATGHRPQATVVDPPATASPPQATVVDPPTTGHRPPTTASPEKGPLTTDRLRSLWPSIVAKARTSSAMVGSLLADATVQSVEDGTVTLAAGSGGTSEGLAHKKDGIAKLLSEWVDGAVKVSVVSGASSVVNKGAPAARPERLNERSANAERLKVLRAKDPTLGNAVDALDLELME